MIFYFLSSCSKPLNYSWRIIDLCFFWLMNFLWKDLTDFIALFVRHCYHCLLSYSFSMILSGRCGVTHFSAVVWPFRTHTIVQFYLEKPIFRLYLKICQKEVFIFTVFLRHLRVFLRLTCCLCLREVALSFFLTFLE
jgi:hypothetical protein